MKQLNRMIIDEKGSVLVVGMLILVFLTLIGTAAINTSRIETDISGHEVSYKKELYHADAGISWAVGELTPGMVNSTATGGQFPVPANSPFLVIKNNDNSVPLCPQNSNCVEVQSDYNQQTGDRGMGMVSIVAGIALPTSAGGLTPPGHLSQY